jgi:hypothetical protein
VWLVAPLKRAPLKRKLSGEDVVILHAITAFLHIVRRTSPVTKSELVGLCLLESKDV